MSRSLSQLPAVSEVARTESTVGGSVLRSIGLVGAKAHNVLTCLSHGMCRYVRTVAEHATAK